MPLRNNAQFEAVSALIQGERDHQEDAVVTDFPLGSDTGLVVLADGMGGHAAGDIASKIVMTEVYSELKFQSTDPEAFAEHLPQILMNAAFSANECVRAHIEENPSSYGMGATLVAAVLLRNRLHWISVGDSPLYLFRDGALTQLNEDHSMAPQIDLMVERGMMEAEVAACHPDRNALTSVLGGDEISKIDCPKEGIELRDGDIVLVASDGLQFLEDHEIEAVLDSYGEATGMAIARNFLKRIEALEDPDQDNTSLAVIKVKLDNSAAERDDDAADASDADPVAEAAPDESPEDAEVETVQDDATGEDAGDDDAEEHDEDIVADWDSDEMIGDWDEALGIDAEAEIEVEADDPADVEADEAEPKTVDGVVVETLVLKQRVFDEDEDVRPRRVRIENEKLRERPKKAEAQR